MLNEDKKLVFKFNCGSSDALQRIYEKFKEDLLGLAITLLWDRSLAEDVVHDVFVSFARTAGRFRLTGSLKGYLSTCVANTARDKNRLRSGRNVSLDAAASQTSDTDDPQGWAVGQEEARQVQTSLQQLPYEQREIIVLHLHQGLRFREVAQSLGVSINTVQSRYRYGMEKLHSLLNSLVTP